MCDKSRCGIYKYILLFIYKKLLIIYFLLIYTGIICKILLFMRNNFSRRKSPSANAKGLEIGLAPQTERLSQLLYE